MNKTIKCLILGLLLSITSFPGTVEAQKWDTPIRPVADTVPNADWYDEVSKLTEQIKEQAIIIEQLSKDLKESRPMEAVAAQGCTCAEHWVALDKRLAAMDEAIQALQKGGMQGVEEVATPEADERIVIELHTFTLDQNGNPRPCFYCDQWVAKEYPKLQDTYKLEIHNDIVNQKVPRFRVCKENETCFEIVGYITAEELERKILE